VISPASSYIKAFWGNFLQLRVDQNKEPEDSIGLLLTHINFVLNK